MSFIRLDDVYNVFNRPDVSHIELVAARLKQFREMI
jgi:hypothetical protein